MQFKRSLGLSTVNTNIQQLKKQSHPPLLDRPNPQSYSSPPPPLAFFVRVLLVPGSVVKCAVLPIMAGMLPGVECARRRRVHLSSSGCGGSTDLPTSSRRSSFCLYTTGHETHLSSTSSKRCSLNKEIHEEGLGHIAREAKDRLDARLKIKRHNSLESLKQQNKIPGNVQREVFSCKKSSRRFRWNRIMGWTSTEQVECAVCLEEFKDGDILSHLPCAHRFHWNCALPWLESTSHCPCCRMSIFI